MLVKTLVYILVELWKGCMWVPALFTGLSRIPENVVYKNLIKLVRFQHTTDFAKVFL